MFRLMLKNRALIIREQFNLPVYTKCCIMYLHKAVLGEDIKFIQPQIAAVHASSAAWVKQLY